MLVAFCTRVDHIHLLFATFCFVVVVVVVLPLYMNSGQFVLYSFKIFVDIHAHSVALLVGGTICIEISAYSAVSCHDMILDCHHIFCLEKRCEIMCELLRRLCECT